MKSLNHISKLLFTLVVLASVSFTTLKAQSADPVFKEVANAIQSNSADKLAVSFNSSVEITTPDADGSYASTQATFVMKEFFSKYPVKPNGFKIVHKGNSGSTYYATGSYASTKGNFDTNIFVKQVKGKLVVTQIRFEGE